MPRSRRPRSAPFLERMSTVITRWTGSTAAFALACLVILAWVVTGPLFGYSDTWQLVINTGTTIITFLMVFLIQRAQNKDSMAIQLKLNELVAAVEGASNRLIDVEDLSEEELVALHRFYAQTGRHGQEGREPHGVTLRRGGRGTARAEEVETQRLMRAGRCQAGNQSSGATTCALEERRSVPTSQPPRPELARVPCSRSASRSAGRRISPSDRRRSDS